MTNIDRIMYLIDWRRSPSEQQCGISLARDVSCLKCFFQPIGPDYSKSVWDNCAVIISERTDKELEPYIPEMLFWLEDLNWPGAEQIQNRLLQFTEVDRLALTIDRMVPSLKCLGKDSWLIFLADLLINKKLMNALSTQTVHILSQYRKSSF